jgi:hypothetical protein
MPPILASTGLLRNSFGVKITASIKWIWPVLVVLAMGAGTLAYVAYGKHAKGEQGLVRGQADDTMRGNSTTPISGDASVAEKKKALTIFRTNRKSDAITTQHVSVPHPFPNMPRTRAGLSMEDDPFAPQSEAEQRWLDRNGYPNAEQWSEYPQAGDAQLEQAANAGDIVAETFLNVRKLQAGDEAAEGALLYSGALGNTFALEMLSSVFSGSGKLRDPMEGYALSRVAEMRGNLSLGLARELLSPNRLTQQEKAEAEVRALQYFKLLMETQKETQGIDVVSFDPRPVGGG